MKKAKSVAGALAFLFFPFFLQAQLLPSIFDQAYREGEVLTLTLTTDVEQLIANIKEEEWQAARFQFLDREGGKQSWQIKIRPRGNYRRRVCDFPPVKLKFPKDRLEKLGFSEHNDLKLVSHCLANEREDQLVLREYLLYEMYRILDPLSYRAQLVQIHYLDSESKTVFDRRYAILLEDTDEMAERNGRLECDECFGLTAEKFDPRQLATLQLFQYLIGNHDWSLKFRRNVKVLYDGESQPLVAVPYDFDFAEMVGAQYAQREAVRFPESSAYLQEAAGQFWEKEEELYRLVKNHPLLNTESKKLMMPRLKSFFRELGRKVEPRPPMARQDGSE